MGSHRSGWPAPALVCDAFGYKGSAARKRGLYFRKIRERLVFGSHEISCFIKSAGPECAVVYVCRMKRARRIPIRALSCASVVHPRPGGHEDVRVLYRSARQSAVSPACPGCERRVPRRRDSTGYPARPAAAGSALAHWLIVVRLLAFVLLLAVDSFAVAALLGASGVTRAQRMRITAVFVVFEAGMPLVGLALGAPLARTIGYAAGYVAAVALVALGIWILLGDEQRRGQRQCEQAERARRPARGRRCSREKGHGYVPQGLVDQRSALVDRCHFPGGRTAGAAGAQPEM